MLKHWRHKARAKALSSFSDSSSPEVPAGHVAVYVGASAQRFIVRARYLNHPIFQTILAQAEEEYEFKNDGPLQIPCDEWEFEQILRFVSRSDAPPSYSCSNGERLPPSKTPLLRG
ncbi:Auxin-responsive protein SAUR71 [Linum grandiflorum]